jgi:transposase-like protein
MRYPAAEKLEIIRLVEQSHLPVRRTLTKIGIPPTTFYRWYDRFVEHGPVGLEDRPSCPSRVWNRIPTIGQQNRANCDGGSLAVPTSCRKAGMCPPLMVDTVWCLHTEAKRSDRMLTQFMDRTMRLILARHERQGCDAELLRTFGTSVNRA